MTTRDDGGAAFPHPFHYGNSDGLAYGALGMTLRDYFAAQIVVGLMSSPQIHAGGDAQAYTTEFPRVAYLIADAMLEARKK